MNKIKSVIYAIPATLVASPVFAAGLDLSKVQVDLSPVYTLATVIVSAGVGMFAVRKVIKLMNRS